MTKPAIFAAINIIGGRVRHAGAIDANTGNVVPVCHRPIIAPRVSTDDQGRYLLGPVTCHCCLVKLGVAKHRGGRPREERPLCPCGKECRARRGKHCSKACQYRTLRNQVYSDSRSAVAKRRYRARVRACKRNP